MRRGVAVLVVANDEPADANARAAWHSTPPRDVLRLSVDRTSYGGNAAQLEIYWQRDASSNVLSGTMIIRKGDAGNRVFAVTCQNASVTLTQPASISA